MPIHLIFGLLLSIAIGLSLGLIGGGGSIITVPVLIYVIGVDAHQAIGMSLAVVGITSLIGTSIHRKKGKLNLGVGLLFGASGIPGAYLGARLKYLVPTEILLLLFAGLMILTSVLMILRKQDDQQLEIVQERKLYKAIPTGLGVGFLTGFLGVGGGFLIVPALVLFGGLAMKDAIGTSLLVIAINCAAGLIGDLSHSKFDFHLAFLVTIFAATGTIVGSALSHKVSPAGLRKGFAMFTFAIAVFLIVKNFKYVIH